MRSGGNRTTGCARRSVDRVVRGVGAGALGPLTMDLWLYRAYRDGGGGEAFAGWESSEGLVGWERGLANGAGYGFVFASHRLPRVWLGLPFGAAVWAGGYVVLPLLGVYQPIWKYDAKTLAKDLGAHLVFGTATAAAFSFLTNLEVQQ